MDINTLLKEIKRLSAKKAIQDTDILVKVLKENAEFFAGEICLHFSEANCSSQVPATFKFANVTPVFKQDSRNLKDSYRPFGILPIISKIFENLMSGQLSNHFHSIFSKFQCSFRKALVHNVVFFR